MIAQFILSILLGGILLYAWTECRRSPAVSFLSVVVATAGLYFVWVPSHSTQLAELVGIGRGVDLIFYVWVCISLILLLSLHLKLRMQMELVTMLARKLALADACRLLSEKAKPAPVQGDLGFFPSPMLAPTFGTADAQGITLEPISKLPEEDEQASELDEAEEVLRVELPADQQTTAPLNSSKEAFDQPAPGVSAEPAAVLGE